MPTWLIVVLGIVVFLVVVAIIFQLPKQNRFIEVAGGTDLDKLRRKLDEGNDPNRTGWLGDTPLSEAVNKNRRDNINLLLERGADVHQPSMKRPILDFAVEAGDPEVVKLLIEKGADPNDMGDGAISGVYVAVQHGKPPMLRLLHEHGGDLEKVAPEGTPLFAYAVAMAVNEKDAGNFGRRKEIVEYLLAQGANPNVRTIEDAPLVGLALSQPEILRILVDHGAIIDVSWEGKDLRPAIEDALAEPGE